jgi:hypothetical protein
MANPWTKKNPLLSLWLRGANSVLARGRGAATAAFARQQSLATKKAVRSWTGVWLAASKSKRRRK